MTENQALALLDARDWRSLNKNQIMSFVLDIAPNLSNEVRLKILESAPDILNTVNVVFSEFQATIRNALGQDHEMVTQMLDQNHDLAKTIFMSYESANKTFRDLLADPNSPYEEKMYWSEQLFRSLREMREFDEKNKHYLDEFDKRNKDFKQTLLKFGSIATAFLICVSLSALTGGKLKIPTVKL
jgi:hypothetical protein